MQYLRVYDFIFKLLLKFIACLGMLLLDIDCMDGMPLIDPTVSRSCSVGTNCRLCSIYTRKSFYPPILNFQDIYVVVQ